MNNNLIFQIEKSWPISTQKHFSHLLKRPIMQLTHFVKMLCDEKKIEASIMVYWNVLPLSTGLLFPQETSMHGSYYQQKDLYYGSTFLADSKKILVFSSYQLPHPFKSHFAQNFCPANTCSWSTTCKCSKLQAHANGN